MNFQTFNIQLIPPLISSHKMKPIQRLYWAQSFWVYGYVLCWDSFVSMVRCVLINADISLQKSILCVKCFSSYHCMQSELCYSEIKQCNRRNWRCDHPIGLVFVSMRNTTSATDRHAKYAETSYNEMFWKYFIFSKTTSKSKSRLFTDKRILFHWFSIRRWLRPSIRILWCSVNFTNESNLKLNGLCYFKILIDK